LDTVKFLDKPFFSVLRNAAATIKAIAFFGTPIVAGGIFIGYLLTTHVANNTVLAIIAVVSVVIIVIIAVGFWYYVKHICDPSPYEITEIRCLLVVEPAGNHHRYVNRREQEIKATRNNVRLIEHRSHWTGKGPKAKSRAGSIVASHEFYCAAHPEEDGRTHQWIYLGRPLSKGDTATVGIHQSFEDSGEPMRTYYREGSGRYKGRNLTVTTRFLVDEDPPKVEGVIWNNDRKSRQRHEVGRLTYTREPDPATHTVDYTVTVRNPKRYHSYGIRWDWSARRSK
jgi:hypothetical protein